MDRKKVIRRISKWKIWFDRSRQYVGYVQFMLLAYIAVKSLNNSPARTWVFDNWYISFPLIFIIFLSGCMVLGFIESILKIREYEQENYLATNPEWQKLLTKLDKYDTDNSDKGSLRQRNSAEEEANTI